MRSLLFIPENLVIMFKCMQNFDACFHRKMFSLVINFHWSRWTFKLGSYWLKLRSFCKLYHRADSRLWFRCCTSILVVFKVQFSFAWWQCVVITISQKQGITVGGWRSIWWFGGRTWWRECQSIFNAANEIWWSEVKDKWINFWL